MDNDTLTVKFYNQCDADFWNAIPGDQRYKCWGDICTTLSRQCLVNEKTKKLIYGLLSGDTSRPLGCDQDVRERSEDRKRKKISERSFMLLTARFGSTQPRKDSCYLVQQVQNLSNSIVNYDGETLSWFGGEMTMDEAEKRLEFKPDGTYLVRFSEGYAAQGGFAFSVKGVVKKKPAEGVVKKKPAEGSSSHSIYHYRILGHPETASSSNKYDAQLRLDVGGEEHELTYPNIVDFVKNRIHGHTFDGIQAEFV
uniref:SH2 domain-containing protein n=2 Tax=Ciona intestinalis TaxID=7719 RepID=H2XX13_CIOIN